MVMRLAIIFTQKKSNYASLGSVDIQIMLLSAHAPPPANKSWRRNVGGGDEWSTRPDRGYTKGI